jgi:hypothetical protein
MPNQPAKDSVGIYIRVHESIKAAIQADVDRINAEIPGANMSISGWIRAAIEARLVETKKSKQKNK